MLEKEAVWKEVPAGRKSNNSKITIKKPAYIKLSNAYATLPQFNDPLPKHDTNKRDEQMTISDQKQKSTYYQQKIARRIAAKQLSTQLQTNED